MMLGDHPRLACAIKLAPLEKLLACADSGDEHALLWAATQAVVELLGEQGFCVLVDGEARIVVSTYCPTLTHFPIEVACYPELTSALEQRKAVTIADAHHDPRLEPARELIPPEVQSIAAVPLIVGDRRLGVISAQSSSVREPSHHAVMAAEWLARLTAHLLDSIRQRSAARRPRERPEQGRRGAAMALALATWAQAEAPPFLTNSPASRARRVLVIEDEMSHSVVISAMLEDAGYEVDLAANGKEGLERALESPPDMVVLDVRLPILDGKQVAERLRQEPMTEHVPILFVSACDDMVSRVRGMELMDFVAKPIYGPDLLMRIERMLRETAIV